MYGALSTQQCGAWQPWFHRLDTLLEPNRDRLSSNRTACSAHPNGLCWIELSRKPARITNNHRVGGEASGNQGVRSDNAVAAYDQLTLIAHNCRALANPATLLDSDSASGCNPL